MVREFRLYNHDMSRSISLSSDFVYATNPKGLGSRFNLSKHNDLIYKVETNFEPITMTLNFLKKSYETYSIFKNFIYENGDNKFVFAYNYKKPNKIVKKSYPTSATSHELPYPINLSKIWADGELVYDCGEINENFKIIIQDDFHSEIFRIERLSSPTAIVSFNKDGSIGWGTFRFSVDVEYTTEDNFVYCDCFVESISKTEKTNFRILSENVVFNRISMWYSFETLTFGDTLTFTTDPITNIFTKPLPVKIMYQSSYENWLEVWITDVCLIDIDSVKTIIIDPENKTVKDFLGNDIYEKLDKKDNTFMFIPKGTYQISCELANGSGTKIVLIIKKWLAD